VEEAMKKDPNFYCSCEVVSYPVWRGAKDNGLLPICKRCQDTGLPPIPITELGK
jgi:hypothetical protein